ncbi:MAG: arginase family protein [Thermomicrobiales bacterium]
MRVEVITVPYRYDEYDEGLGAGPGALIDAGIAARLVRAGHEVGEVRTAHLPEEEREPGQLGVNIGRLGAETAALVAAARRQGIAVFVLAGDDTASIGVAAGLELAHGVDARIGVVWLDAHGDFNTPETSYSGILAGMPVAILAGLAAPRWRAAAGLSTPIPPSRMLIAGVRELDDQESTLLKVHRVSVVTTDQIRDGTALAEAVSRLADQSDALCLHVDLDVLDPHLVPSASTPSQHGLEIPQAAAAMATVLATGKVAVLCLAGLNPGGGDRGRRSIATALSLIEQALPAWAATPSPAR